MIKSIQIRNFQSHKNTKLKFSKRVNTIVGKTDAGKSGVFRAINWVVNNRPVGDSFKRKNAKNVSVVLDIGTSVITRKKGRENYYQANEHKYKSFGQSVPNDISSILNIDEINLQPQMSLPFLLSKSSGEVARFFNKTIDLEQIDSALNKIGVLSRQESTRLKIKREEYKVQKEKLKQYKNLDMAEGILSGLEAHTKSISLLSEQKRKVLSLLKDISASKNKISELCKTNIDKVKSKLTFLLKELEEIQTLKKERTQTVDLIEKIQVGEQEIRHLKKLFIKLQREFKRKFPEICPLCGK